MSARSGRYRGLIRGMRMRQAIATAMAWAKTQNRSWWACLASGKGVTLKGIWFADSAPVGVMNIECTPDGQEIWP